MSRSAFIRWQLILWTGYASIRFFALLPAVQDDERGMLALMQLIRAVTGFAVSCCIALVLVRQSRREQAVRWPPVLLTAVAAAVAWMFVDRILLVAVAPVVGGGIPWQSVPRGLELEYFFVLLGWSGGAVSLLQAQRGRELRQALLQRDLDAQAATLEALTAQLNPHFLFNALNMIRSLVVDDPALAREMLTRLSTLLRRILEIDTRSLIELQEEFSLLADYLHIQKARFEHGLAVDLQMPDDLRTVRVPPLILQPLVENAFKFGAPGPDGVRRVRVQAARLSEGVEIAVHNTGRINGIGTGHGLGLQLTSRRLRAIYQEASVQLEEAQGTVVARIYIQPGQHQSARD